MLASNPNPNPNPNPTPNPNPNPNPNQGESYAGKYVPAAAYAIHASNAQLPPSQRINLQGISIGDGAFAPEVQLSGGFGDLLYNMGMVSHEERAVFYAYEARSRAIVSRAIVSRAIVSRAIVSRAIALSSMPTRRANGWMDI